MTAYKLTDAEGYTRRGEAGETHWAVGQTVAPVGVGTAPCGPGVLHLYASPEEAVLYDSMHGRYTTSPGTHCFRVVAEITGDDGLKQWTTKPVTVNEEIPLPAITLEERVAWAICLAPHPSTRVWAMAWLSGADRSRKAAAVAAWAEEAAVAAVAADWAAARAAEAAVAAAWSAAAWVAQAAEESALAAEAAEEAAAAARASVWAAEESALAATTARSAAAGAAGRTDSWQAKFHTRSLVALQRARAILTGNLPAEEYNHSLA